MASPLADYLKVQKATDQAILSTLRASAASIDSELRRLQSRTGVGAAIRREQLLMTQVAMNREMERLWTRVGDIVEAQKAAAAGVAAEGILRDSSVLSSLFSAADRDYMARSAAATATRGLEAVERRLEGSSYVPLKESVYNNAALSSGKIDEIVNAALARGASAAELARDVRAYVNPNTPGGVRYASLRLGRTEINNSFHASQVKQAQEEPWTTGLRWHLSGSHPVPDECNQYAEKTHYEGGEPGVFRPSEAPGKPHPNCLCYTTNETVDPDEFIRQFEAGAYDDHLEKKYPDLPNAPSTPSPKTFSGAHRPGASEGDYDLENPTLVVDGKHYRVDRLSSSPEFKKSFSPQEREAMDRYTSGQTFFDFKQAYLDKTPFPGSNGEDLTEVLEGMFGKVSLAHDTTLYRSMRMPRGWADTVSPGGEIDHHFFVSTTTDPGQAKAYGSNSKKGSESIMLKILAPEGTKVVPGADILEEVILHPTSRMEVERVSKLSTYTLIVVRLK